MSFFLTASNIKPNYDVTFHNGDRNIGRLDFNGDSMVFEGDAEESAQVFFDYLAERFANRLKEERDNEREACEKVASDYANYQRSLGDEYAELRAMGALEVMDKISARREND